MTKYSLRLALLAATLTAGTLAAQATPRQAAPAQTGPGGQRGATLKDLNLTADQQTRIEALIKDEMPSVASAPPTDAERQAMQTRRADLETKLKTILTPEQYAKYQAVRPQRGMRGVAAPSN